MNLSENFGSSRAKVEKGVENLVLWTNCECFSCDLNKMAQPKSINVLAHLQKRQSGDNIEHFHRTLFNDRLKIARNLYKKDLVSHYGCVNAIEFSKEGELLVSGEYYQHFKPVISAFVDCGL